MKHNSSKVKGPTIIFLVAILFIFLCPLRECFSAEPSSAIPTIEELTNGKVKVGDSITKDNVDLVKDLLPVGVYELVKRGMVLIIGEHYPLDKLVPKYFVEATNANKGKATIDENGIVRLKDGSLWPGGLPFPEPKTGMEVLANLKYGAAADDISFKNQWLSFISKEGEIYKKFKQLVAYCNMTHRLKCPPLGAYPGYENENWRRMQSFRDPLDMRGLGQFSIRYYNDTKDSDTGFAYLPAFKRTLRVSATTWQDNIGGSDVLYCDAAGINDPISYWNYKLIGKKFMLTTATKTPLDAKGPCPLSNEEGDFNTKNLKFDVGQKFPRVWWAVTPVYVLEATPKMSHVYGKKVIYMAAPPFWVPWFQTLAQDIYDRQMKLYKAYIAWLGGYICQDGDNYAQWYGFDMNDLQTGHSTRIFAASAQYNTCLDGSSFNLKKMLELGK